MNIASNPRLLALLSAAYTLGTLGAGARRRFETLARDHASVRVSALLWRERLAGLVELAHAVDPPEAVWIRIRNLVEAELDRERAGTRPAVRPQESRWGNLALWRGAAAFGFCAAVLAGVVGTHWWNEAREARPVQYVAILADAGASPSMLVTFDPRSRQLTLQRIGGYREAADRSLQLWALPPGRTPQSLGVMAPSERGERLPADARTLQQAPALAISLEPKGGVPGDRGPTGPVLFTGPLIEKTL